MKFNSFRFLIFIFILESSECYSQVFYNNPSFENDSGQCFGCVPPGWVICHQSPDNIGYIASWPSPYPSDGLLYMGIQGGILTSAPSFESFGQMLSCNLKNNHHYYFYFDCVGFFGAGIHWVNGITQIFGGIDSCDASILLWETPILDTLNWLRFKAEFPPPIDIQFLTFSAKRMANYPSNDLIDNLSPIYCTNFNQVHLATAKDTSITKGECVALSASATTGYDSIYWQSIPAGFSAATLNAGEVCPAQSTTYIVAIRDTSCGSFWSYDTLRVEVTVPDAPILNGTDNNGTIQIISNDDGYLVLYDLLGRTVRKIPVIAGIQTIILGNYYLSASMYIADIEAANKRTVRKLILVK